MATLCTCLPIITCDDPLSHAFYARTFLAILPHLPALTFLSSPQVSTNTTPALLLPVQHAESKNTITEKLNALQGNNTWTFVPLPSGKKSIGSKWVHKLKLKVDGSIDRYKARLMVKGYHQVEAVDYNDSFLLIVKAINVRLSLAIVLLGWASPATRY
ncbi:UNVERIFIED_CONTAM: putative mitochondrial protein [Sesamum radiatum]|uniref:Mitochondrial protein n=1 Tax=Sesamum radiatum TaxID=300843 RepID=A0AAW2JN94_SESRA